MNVLGCPKKRGKDYEQGYDKGFKTGVKVSIKIMMFGVIQFLGDKRGWKRERIFEALQWLHKYAEMQIEEYTSFKEVVEAVREEYGIVEEDGIYYELSEEEWKK